MPQMGESIFEGTITKWLKKPGDKVERDEPLFEISTDKVEAEIPSPTAGVLKEIKVKEGQTVPINTVVATIDGAGAAVAVPAPAPTPAATPAAKPEAPKPVAVTPPTPAAAPRPGPVAVPAPQAPPAAAATAPAGASPRKTSKARSLVAEAAEFRRHLLSPLGRTRRHLNHHGLRQCLRLPCRPPPLLARADKQRTARSTFQRCNWPFRASVCTSAITKCNRSP